MGSIIGGSPNVTVNGLPVAREGDQVDGGGGGGTPGQAATITIGTVSTGAPGSNASVTNVGDTSNAVFDFVIPQGLTGNTGPQGIPGVPGPAGANGVNGADGTAATITIGTVTTGAPGSNASVINVGNTSNAVFNFTIPAGANGANGANGATGATPTIAVGNVTYGPSLTITNSGNSTAAVFDFTFQNTSWGSIIGTLSSQTDLQNALNAKLNLSGGTLTGTLSVKGPTSVASFGPPGPQLNVPNATINDSGSASGATVTLAAMSSFQQTTMTATNPVTYTDAATVFIGAPPAAGNNVTITNAWSLKVNTGNCYFGGSLTSAGTVTVAGNMSLMGNTSGLGTNNYVLNFYANRWLTYNSTSDRFSFGNVGLDLAGSLNFGSTVASSATDLSHHINLWGANQYGFSVTSSTLNLVAGTQVHAFVGANYTSPGNVSAAGGVHSQSASHSLGTVIWNGQGAYIGWNRNYGSMFGETDFINHKGGGNGGHVFWNTDGTTYTALATIDGTYGSITSINGTVSGIRLFSGWDSGTNGAVSCNNWFRSSGQTGWFSNDYGGGIYMIDATYLRSYNNKAMVASDFVISSDEILKDDIKPLEYRGRLTPITYVMRSTGQLEIGFGAGAVQSLYPELVDLDPTEKTLKLKYARTAAVLSAQLNHVEDKVDEHEKMIKQILEKING